MKHQTKTLYITYTGLFAAIICLTTAFLLHIPVGNGYIHLGDTFIYLAACLLPAPYGICAAAIGGGLADLLCGYTAYVLPTMLIKSLLAACFYLLGAGKNGTMLPKLRRVMASVICIPVTVIGYWLTAYVLYGNLIAQLLETLLPNLVQAGGSAAAFLILAFAIERTKLNLPGLS